MRGVRGNCDWSSRLPFTDMITVEEKKILFTHGHLYNVKENMDIIMDKARECKADIVLFGHTHIASSVYTDGLHVMNPGSAAEPRSGSATYGFIDIDSSNIYMGIVTI